MADPGGAPDAADRPGRARSARYAGLVGATLLTVAGWLGGALPDAPATTPVGIWRGPHGPLVLGCWLVGTALLVGAWWALRRGAPSTRWAYLTAGLWLLPLLAAPPTGSRDVYSYVCQGWSWTHGADPYRVGVAVAGCPWTDAVPPIWRHTPAPYGPFFVLLAGLAVTLGGGLVGAVVLLRVLAVVGVLLAALCLPGLARAVGVPTRRAAWLALACPLVGVHLVGGAHNDALLLGLLLSGLLVLVHRPGKPRALLLAGVLLGLAVAVKAVAVVVLPFAALAAVLGRRYTARALLRDAAWLAGGVVAALLATSLVTGLGFGWVGGLARSGDSEQWTSPPTAVGFVVDYAGALVGREPHAVPVVRLVALLVLAVLLVALWWWAWSALRRLNDVRQRAARPRVALVGAGLALAATALLVPVFHPWYATWPLAVLSVATVPVARTTWFVLPCAVVSFLALPDGTNLARFTKAPGAIAMAAVVVALGVGAVRVALARRARPT
ncbi:polyprenol phosphomannose-dependent alpha 1,6 mannosyltransferase MptB [Micromonospora sp. 4G57]|uniref:Polyprenol phosphomannose-dependent alpha 1,6 mannosyltransferase MptB n=1 Tax=Micromonospora sicca TaxID=2202420 RepID=A0ABU5JKV1_9ACTN|nr:MULTISPECIES: polyprenol phosphomannose-dependent alpha 1,6 mannosyltransferase MptB [unclassified Micromonospora]MDZ5446431.1 polyprenol phosphomannose-dependent alpha 1,6 mannosyltransferase MptB [Micromonospora sp. 4G57]MDZ5493038.1 polyprenol phosphomannose-dependent alpha 1,6 mannosyltransferase MptB [Micromonospora sp. 4G53]